MVVVKKELEKRRDSIIEKGGSCAIKEDTVGKKRIHLHIPVSMLKEIDELVKEKVFISRNTWFLQTIQRALKEISVYREYQ